MKKAKWYLLFFVLFAGLGYLREFFFVHLNILMYEKYYHSVSPVPPGNFIELFRGLSYETLYYSKYFYTLLFTALFFGTSYLALKKLSYVAYLPRTLIYIYLLMVFIASVSMAYGYLVNGRLQDEEYTVSRWLLGIAQSPIICLILVASEKLYYKSFTS